MPAPARSLAPPAPEPPAPAPTATHAPQAPTVAPTSTSLLDQLCRSDTPLGATADRVLGLGGPLVGAVDGASQATAAAAEGAGATLGSTGALARGLGKATGLAGLALEATSAARAVACADPGDRSLVALEQLAGMGAKAAAGAVCAPAGMAAGAALTAELGPMGMAAGGGVGALLASEACTEAAVPMAQGLARGTHALLTNGLPATLSGLTVHEAEGLADMGR